MIGKTVSHYHIIEKLGQGGMGVVYKAEDTKLERIVALKFLSREFILDSEAKSRLIREAKTTARLNHINICTIYEIDEKEDQLFIAMEFIEGKSLQEKYGNSSLSIEESLTIISQIISGLSHAHKLGIFHRDIKPTNILITHDGIVKIVDFGIAKLKGQTQYTQVGKVIGSIDYISPEQAGGNKVDLRTDIWSTGILLYQLLTGKLPFNGDYDQVIIYSILHEEPAPLSSILPDLSSDIEGIVNKCLQKDPNKRYQHIRELKFDLAEATGNEEIGIDKTDIGQKKWLRKLSIPAGIFITLIIAVMLIKPLISNKPDLENPIRIAVISFENQTGSEAYDYLQEAIPNLLITSLEQSPYLRVTTWERMHDLMRQIGRKDIQVINKDLGYQLCRMDGVGLIVLGRYVKAGEVFATDIKVYDVTTNKIITSSGSQGEGISSILKHQINDLSKGISRSIGLSEDLISSAEVDMAKVTTSSMEAYRNFLEGLKKFDKQYFNEARLYFENAVELDSTFATAHLLLVFTYGNLREIEKEQASLDKAILYAGKVSEKERLKIEEMEAVYRENDPVKRVQILEQLVERYPFEKDARYSLAWYYYYDKYMYDEALEQYQKLLNLDPEYSIALRDVANIYLELRNFEKVIEYTDKYLKCDPNNASAQRILAKMHFYKGEYPKSIEKFKNSLEIKPDFNSDIWIAYTYALMGNFPEALNHLDGYIDIAPSPGLKAQGYWFKGFIQCWSGQFKDSEVNFQHASKLWKSGGNKYGLAVINMTQAYGYLSRGRYEQSRQSIKKWVEYESKNSGDPGGAYLIYGIIHCQQGELDSARHSLKQLQELAPRRKNRNEAEARLVDHIFTGLNAEVLLAEGAFERAITEGEKNKQLVIPRFGLRQFVAFNIPFLKDYLPRAFELKGDIGRAIQEYEFLISVDRGKERFRLIHPIYYYRLAILYERTEQYDKALDTYKKFLELWENADKDLPELMDAKSKVEALSKYAQAV